MNTSQNCKHVLRFQSIEVYPLYKSMQVMFNCTDMNKVGWLLDFYDVPATKAKSL